MSHERDDDGRGSEEIVLTSRTINSLRKTRLVQRSDIEAILRLGAYGAGIRLLPETRWDEFRRYVPQKRNRSLRQRTASGLKAYFGEAKTASELDAIAMSFVEAMSRRLMLTACEAKRDWSPAVDLRDADRLRQALALGRGVILWCDSFVSQSLIGKRMLHEAGHHAAQVSLTDHGFSKTRLGMRWINSTQQRQELRYADRLDFERGQEAALARRIQKRLRAGGLVTISNNVAAASRIAKLPFGADGQLFVATGPLRIAQSCGAAILPYAVIEEEGFRRYTGYLGENLLAGTPGGKESAEPLTGPLLAYRQWIGPLAERYPSQWMRWETISRSGDIEV